MTPLGWLLRKTSTQTNKSAKWTLAPVKLISTLSPSTVNFATASSEAVVLVLFILYGSCMLWPRNATLFQFLSYQTEEIVPSTWIFTDIYCSPWKIDLTLLLLTMTCPVLANSVDPDQLASQEANWSGSALFVIKYVNFYQKHRSNNLICWKLEVGVAS